MKKQDVVSGTLLIALSVLLYTQTVAPSDAVIFEDDIDPMKYPRLLVLILGLLGVVLAGKGLMLRDAEQGIPGDPVAAIMLATFILHGITPGVRLTTPASCTAFLWRCPWPTCSCGPAAVLSQEFSTTCSRLQNPYSWG